MNTAELCEQLGLSPDAAPAEIVAAFNRVCESCRQTIAASTEKAERRMAKRELKEFEEQLGPEVRRVEARANVEEQLASVEEILRSGVGSVAPYFEEIDRWLPDCQDHALELKVRSLRASAEPEPPATPPKPEPEVARVPSEPEPEPPAPEPAPAPAASGKPAPAAADARVRGRVFLLKLDEAETLLSVGTGLQFGRERKGDCDVGLPVQGEGRSPEQLQKLQRSVSRRHFLVERQETQVVLLDGYMDPHGFQKPSTGGLFVDGRKVNSCRLDLAGEGQLTLINAEVRSTRPAFDWRWLPPAAPPAGVPSPESGFGRSLLLERADGYRQRVLFLWDLVAGEELRPELAGLVLVPAMGGFLLAAKGEGLLSADHARKQYKITTLQATSPDGNPQL